MADQLTFDLPSVAALGREAFFVSPSNALAVALLEDTTQWSLHKMLLCGPEKSGKTHLAHVWADQTGAVIVNAIDVTADAIPTLANAPHIIVEDIDRIAGNIAAQDALFHLHNLILAEGGFLLGTGTGSPDTWGITLPDLASRLEGTPLAQLHAADDQLLSMVMLKLFDDRQLSPAPNVLSYLTTRMDRSFAAASAVVAEMDRLALRDRKAISRNIAAAALDNLTLDRA
jgi:chromosomal replication initiation ATPase DnaA